MILTDMTQVRVLLEGDTLVENGMGMQMSFDIETGEDIDPYNIEPDETGKWIKDEEDYHLIKSHLASAGSMRYINDVIMHITEKCSTDVLERVYREHLLVDAMQRVAGTRINRVA